MQTPDLPPAISGGPPGAVFQWAFGAAVTKGIQGYHPSIDGNYSTCGNFRVSLFPMPEVFHNKCKCIYVQLFP